MITPIIVPMDRVESKCPSCGNPENIVRTCRNCGHVYRVPEPTVKEDVITGIVVITIFMVLMVVLMWVIITALNNNLVETAVSQKDVVYSTKHDKTKFTEYSTFRVRDGIMKEAIDIVDKLNQEGAQGRTDG